MNFIVLEIREDWWVVGLVGDGCNMFYQNNCRWNEPVSLCPCLTCQTVM